MRLHTQENSNVKLFQVGYVHSFLSSVWTRRCFCYFLPISQLFNLQTVLDLLRFLCFAKTCVGLCSALPYTHTDHECIFQRYLTTNSYVFYEVANSYEFVRPHLYVYELPWDRAAFSALNPAMSLTTLTADYSSPEWAVSSFYGRFIFLRL